MAMGEEEAKKMEASVEAGKDLPEEKAVAQPPLEEKTDESKALVAVEKVADSPPPEKSSAGSADRDAVLARVATEKRITLIKAWEESEKTKAENKAQKKLSNIASWEKTKQAAVEAELKKIEQALEMKKAEYAEKVKNKIAMIHKAGAEKKAIVEAKRGEEILKAEETAAKYKAKGLYPKKVFGCFSA